MPVPEYESAKQRDLSILEFIPSIYHPFYHGLVSGEDGEDSESISH